MGFLLDLYIKNSEQRAAREVLAQYGSDESIKDLLLAQHFEKEVAALAEELHEAGDIERYDRVKQLLGEATRSCLRLLAEWEPTQKQRRLPQ